MQQLTRAEAQTLWHTSEKLTDAAYAQLQTSDVTAHQSPAIFSYVGIQYQYLSLIHISEPTRPRLISYAVFCLKKKKRKKKKKNT
ncbi:hypothetical protein AMBR_DPAELIID_02788 [Lacticaseibacillus rhamnosus]|nr:hypothetical protein AMBR_DPAELIID_02788 [Lacticaseibacillus rhamnosus]